MNVLLRAKSSLFFLIAAFAADAAHASNYCVGTAQGLRDALDDAATNNQDDTIKVAAGTYFGAEGSTVSFEYSTTQNRALTIAGGYDSGCVRHGGAGRTVLSGSYMRQVLRLFSGSGNTGAISVSNLTVRYGETEGPGGGMYIGGPSSVFEAGFRGNVKVERVVFVENNSGATGGALEIATNKGTVIVRGNLMAFNDCVTDFCAFRISSHSTAADPVLSYIGGNTFAYNRCTPGAPLCDTPGVQLRGNHVSVIYNNLFAGHDGGDLEFNTSSVDAELYFNNIESITGTPVTEVGTVDLDPEFIDVLAYNFRLDIASPLIDLGNAPYALPTIDLDGRSRIVGSAPDLGAYESRDQIFADGFDD